MPAATATVEIVGSRKTDVSVDDPRMEVLFMAMGTDNDLLIRAQVEAALSPVITIYSAFFGARNMIIQSYSVEHRGNGVWDGVAHYGRQKPRKTGDVVFTFDSTGGKAK